MASFASRTRGPGRPPAPVSRAPLEPEVLPRQPPGWIETVAWLMDRSIPIGRRWSIGLDAVVGLVPGVGDLLGALVSVLVIMAGIRARLPRAAIARMAVNTAIDALLGAVPFVGDLFDAAYKANTKNLEIFRQALAGSREPARDWGFLLLVLLALLAVLAIPVVGLVMLVRALSGA
jgi:Domain of unknown function (DUF4112)